MRRLIPAALALALCAAPAAAQMPNGSFPVLQPALTATVVTLKGTGPASIDAFNCGNTGADVAYVQVFDAASATAITLGTTTPTLSLAIPPTGVGEMSLDPLGTAFYNGIKVAATTLPTGNTAPTPLTCNFWIR